MGAKMSKARAAARTWGFWISLGIAGLGAVQTGLEQLHAAISPLWFGITNMVVGVILVLILLGALPTWGYSRNWGYGPSGLLGTLLLIVIILVLLRYI